MSVDDEPGLPSTNFTAADIPITTADYDNNAYGDDEEAGNLGQLLLAFDEAITAAQAAGVQWFNAAPNVPAVDPELTDADTAVNAVIAALITSGLMEAS